MIKNNFFFPYISKGNQYYENMIRFTLNSREKKKVGT